MRRKIKNAISLPLLLLFFTNSPQSSEGSIAEDEAGLLRKVEKHEQLIRTSSFRTKNVELENGLQDMACKIAPEHCSDLRVYLLDLPGLNAFVMPNGSIFIQSGLLLRVEDESQLAAVMAHEIVHFEEKHSLESMRRASDQAATLAVIGALVGAAGNVATAGATSAGQIQSISNATQTASLMLQSMQVIGGLALLEFSRDNEEESDMRGADMAAAAGYSKAAGMELWLAYLEEDKAAGDDTALSLLSTHPLPETRVKYLAQFRQEDHLEHGTPPTSVVQSLFSHRENWLLLELRVLHPDQFAHLADKQIRDWDINTQLVNHMKAESWIRYSDRQGLSSSRVREAREKASQLFAAGEKAPGGLSADGYRDWGMLALELGDHDGAKYALEQYLILSPEAWDARFVEKKLAPLK